MTEADMVLEVRQIGQFDSVLLKDIGKLTIVQGEPPQLTVESSPELLSKVEATIKGHQLVLEIRMSWFEKVGASVMDGFLSKPLNYTLTTPNLKALAVFGVGHISTGSLKAEELQITVNGTGSVTVSELTGSSLDVRLNGTGGASILGGKVGRATVISNGTGEYMAELLEAEQAKVTINGLGRAKVFATNKLEVEMFGAGELSYRGKPALVQDIQGVGRVTCLEEI